MSFELDGMRLDDPQHVFIIAEASGNHGQSYVHAERLVAAAAEAGASAIKFQCFLAEEICADVPILFGYDEAHDAWCRRQQVTRLRELMARGGLPRPWHAPLKKLAEDLGLVFLCTPFSVDAARFLVEEIGVPALKIASGDLTFQPLLRYAAETKLPLLLSTGMATSNEVDDALCYVNMMRGKPVYGRCDDIALLHCRSIYPCPNEATNLETIRYFAATMPVGAIGWSDHTLSVDFIPALAVALGATVLEKHLRLPEDVTSIDVGHSLTPRQFQGMVTTVRALPSILGTRDKAPHPLEAHERLWTRRDPGDWLRPTAAAREGHWA